MAVLYFIYRSPTVSVVVFFFKEKKGFGVRLGFGGLEEVKRGKAEGEGIQVRVVRFNQDKIKFIKGKYVFLL